MIGLPKRLAAVSVSIGGTSKGFSDVKTEKSNVNRYFSDVNAKKSDVNFKKSD